MATPEFLAQWRQGTGALALLARIDLPRTDGTQVDSLFISQGEVSTLDDSSNGDPARLWQAIIRAFGPVHATGGFGSTDLSLCTGDLVLYADRTVTFPALVGAAVTETLRQALSDHVWAGATVNLWRHFPALGDFRHAQRILKDAVITDWRLETDAISIAFRQSTFWNRPLMPRTVARSEFPRALDAAVGMSLPIDYGKLTLPMRRPFTSDYPTNQKFYNVLNSGGGTLGRYARGLLVDTGRGGDAGVNPNTKVLVSGHALASVYDDGLGTAMWLDLGGPMCLLDAPGSIINAPDGAGISLSSGFATGLVGAIPRDVVAIANSALDPRNILDPNDTTYCYLDKANNRLELRMVFASIPNITTLATLSEYRLVVGYVSDSALAGLVVYKRGILDAEATANEQVMVLEASTVPTIKVSGGIGLFFGADLPENQCMSIRFSGGAGTCKVFFAGIVFQVQPARTLIQTERVTGMREVPIIVRGHPVSPSIMAPFRVPVTIPAVTELRGDFYANLHGQRDDVAGTYTGTAGSVIERAPDIMLHMLVNYGGVLLADIERGASTFGSFSLARTHLALPVGGPNYALSIIEGVDLLTALLWLTSESLSQPTVSPYDGKFRLNVWRTAPVVDYPYKFSRYDLIEPMGPSCGQTSLPDVVTGIRITYGYDAKQKTQRTETALAYNRSVSGYDFRGLRDQNMTVAVGKNDVLNFTSDGLARTAVMTPAVYVPQSPLSPATGLDYVQGFAQQVKGQMSWAEGTQATGSRYQVTWGAMVTVGYNDRLTFSYVASTFTAKIPPARYATMTDLAAAATTAANAVLGPTGRTVTIGYDITQRKFTVVASGTGLTITRGADYADVIRKESGWATLGFLQTYLFATPISMSVGYADDIRIEDHFAITGLMPLTPDGFALNFQSGPDGADSATAVRSCADLLGFAPAEDKTPAYAGTSFGYSYCADCPKGDRETRLLTSATLYGPRREVNIQSRAIQRTDTAIALRNRIADLFSAPRTVIRFSTRMAPDIERGHVIEFSNDLDTLVEYPAPGSDGSWAGKPFMVIEVSHANGPTSLDTDIVALDMSPLPAIAVPVGQGVPMGGIVQRRLS